MSELTVGDVVFALEQFQVEVDPILLHRIEWSLDWGNHEWSDVRLREELRDFVLRRSRSRYPIMSDMSLDDFLSERGISLRHYRQLIKSLNNTSHFPSFLSVIRLEDFDVDSNVLTYAQHRPERDVFLERLRDLGLSHLQCKVILGLGARSYERLRKQIQDQRKEEIGRTGRSENDAWSFAKHIISELCLRQFKEWIHHSPLVLETHQGIGDASFLYHNHGHVLGFDNHKEAHQMLMERAQISGVYREARDLYLHRSSSSLDTAHSYIFLTEEAISCEQGLKLLVSQGLHFDVVDIDPWTTSQPHFSDVLKVVSDPGLIMITIGDQHPWPKAEIHAWERFDIELYSDILSEADKQVWRRSWMFLKCACAWYMQAALSQSVCLLPILLMRNLEPWSSREDFPNGVMGIDRIYFLAKRIYDVDRIEHIFQSWIEPLPFFDNPMLRTEVSSYVGLSSPLSFVSFIDEIWPAMKPYWSRYHEWLIATAKDIAFRWRCKIPSEVSEARDLLQQAIELACKENVVKGLHLADDWFRNI